MAIARKKHILIIGIIVLVGVLVSGLLYFQKKKSSKDNREQAPAGTTQATQEQASAPLPVKVSTARIQDLEKRIKSPGEVYTERKVTLKAEVKGVLKRLYVQEGKHVRTAELLAGLDDTPYRLKLEQDEATRLKCLSELLLDKLFEEPETHKTSEDVLNLKKAEQALAEAEKGFKEGLISQKELEKARQDYELAQIGSGLKRDEIIASSKGLTQAEVNVKISRMELEKTKITAPFSGIITQIKVAPGETIEAGRELFTLVDVSQLKIEARVLETEVGRIKQGREADIRFSAYPGRLFKGRVAAISPLVSAADRTCSVFINLDNPAEEIKPGMHAEVEIVSEIFEKRLLVPQEAVLQRGGRPLVFVVENGLAKWRYIQIGQENEQFVEVLDGVKEGEQVIVEGHMTLAHDSPVRIIE